MKNKKILSITIFSILLLLFLLPSNMITTTNAFSQNDLLPSIKADPIILIDDDSDFASYPGYGNETHPYIIQGKDIEVGEGESGITVANTTKYFEIRNNEISRLGVSSTLSGILIENVKSNTAKIINNNLMLLGNGIYVEDSKGTVIEDNTLVYVKGIILKNCTNSRIKNNDIYKLVPPSLTFKNNFENELRSNPEEPGNYLKYSDDPEDYSVIFVYDCSDTNITENYMNLEESTLFAGIYITNSDRILVKENIVKNIAMDGLPDFEHWEIAGIFMNIVSYADIINNTFEANEKNNLLVINSENLQISNNSFIGSEVFGLELQSTINTNITYNTIQQHPSFGIVLDVAVSNIIIHHNHFIDNNIGNSQASDSGANNIWFDTTTNEGNWWNNWYGGDYVIAGTASSVDPYPLGTPLIVPELSQKIGLVFFLTSISIIILVIRRSRKK
ncbi:MAG: hypothetical protein GPJ51_09245 [Candidatus Heimdallarchaeota archaeon]|nr:hypothetical protein [Candidatus Heimdallarchaeota archaeon]